MPLLDVIVPARGECPWLEDALFSIAAQTLRPDTVWLVDDGLAKPSEVDGAGQRMFGQKYRRIANSGIGISSALNTAVALSQATWVARMDADDFSHPTRFEEQIHCLSNVGSDYLGCGSHVRLIDERGRRLGDERYPTAWEDIWPLLTCRSCFAHPTLIMRRSALETTPYRSALDGAEDVDLLLRLSLQGRFFNLDKTLLDYRIHVGQHNFIARARQTALQELAFRLHAGRAVSSGEDAVDLAPGMADDFLDWRLGAPGYAQARRSMTALRYFRHMVKGGNSAGAKRCLHVMLAAQPWRPDVLRWISRVYRHGPGSLSQELCPFPSLNNDAADCITDRGHDA